jgi:hypothetical protein
MIGTDAASWWLVSVTGTLSLATGGMAFATFQMAAASRRQIYVRIPAYSDTQSGVFGHLAVRSEVAERPTSV